jgi:lantibiotic biosynthesis protein
MLMLPDPLSLPHELRPPPQSLARGALGVALLPIERAHTGIGDWAVAHSWLEAAASAGVSAGDDACLYNGAPALAFVLHAARVDASGRYARALEALDRSISRLTHRRVDQAEARIARGELPALAEYDVINGLSGIGALLLLRSAGSSAFERLLSYVVRLTEPLDVVEDGGDGPRQVGVRGGGSKTKPPARRLANEPPRHAPDRTARGPWLRSSRSS